MRWLNFKKEDYQSIYPVDNMRGYHVYLSPNSKNLELSEEEHSDMRALFVAFDRNPSVMQLQQALTGFQNEYDNTPEVNGFYINGRVEWLDKATRVGLVNSINAKKSTGADSIELWLGRQRLVVDLDYAEGFLRELELYAMECYNVTAQHSAEIMTLDSTEKLLDYDITQGYPEKISFDLTKIVG